MRMFKYGFLLIFFGSCASSKFCTDNVKYLKRNIDISREYQVGGTYCISLMKDTMMSDPDISLVRVLMFDRVTGNRLENYVTRFYGADTAGVNMKGFDNSHMVKAGKYKIGGLASGYLEAKTKRLMLARNKVYELIFYIGTKVQF